MTPQEQTIAHEGAANLKMCSSHQCEFRGVLQNVSNFSRNSSEKDGFQSSCKNCNKRTRKPQSGKSFPRIPDEHIKMCSGCDTPKAAIEFYRNKSMPDGIAGWCKDCASKATAIWVEKNKDRMRSVSKKWASNNTDKMRAACRKWNRNRWVVKALGSCRNRAAKKGIPFDMKEADLLDPKTGKLPTSCPIFPHIILDYKAGGDQRLWASVDKIVPELGYTSGNVWIISKAANFWKSNGSNPAERRRIIEIMRGNKSRSKPFDSSSQGELFAV